MIRLFGSKRLAMLNPKSTNESSMISSLQKSFSSWRFRNDVAAIVSALHRLNARQLQLIGLHKEGLFDSVCDMILRAEENRAIGRDVKTIMDSSSKNSIDGSNILSLPNMAKASEVEARE